MLHALDRLAALPMAGLASPTPLHRADRLSAEYGIELWCKRDDIGSVALAGNKIRKFDLVLGDAVARGCDLLITTGAGQSNSARAAAAAAAVLGIDCLLLLSGDPPDEPTGNVLLEGLLGAEVRFLGNVGWRELEVAVERAGEAARAAGRGPVLAPVGCSSPLGALGFAAAFLELHEQCRAAGVEPAAIVHASSSAGTHAGLLVGRALARVDTPVIGIDVAAITEDPTVAAAELARSAAALIGVRLQNPGADIRSDFLGPGYGTPDRRTAEAVHVFAALEAIITDPVYSGKGAAGALALAREHDGPVVFWHTGGYHALFDPAHAQALAAASRGLESGHRAD